MYEHCLKISELISEGKIDEAKEYCRENVDSSIRPNTEEYESVKSSAIAETEVWGDESEFWAQILSPSTELNDTEWAFVAGNLLLSMVKEQKTEADLSTDADICKAAHDVLSNIEIADRHENLALALYHHKTGHLARINGNQDKCVEHLQMSVNIVEMSDGLGSWHYHALFLRDLGRAKSDALVEEKENLEALDVLEEFKDRISETQASTTDNFEQYLEAEEYKVRADMAETIGNKERKKKHLEKYESIKNSGQKAT